MFDQPMKSERLYHHYPQMYTEDVFILKKALQIIFDPSL